MYPLILMCFFVPFLPRMLCWYRPSAVLDYDSPPSMPFGFRLSQKTAFITQLPRWGTMDLKFEDLLILFLFLFLFLFLVLTT